MHTHTYARALKQMHYLKHAHACTPTITMHPHITTHACVRCILTDLIEYTRACTYTCARMCAYLYMYTCTANKHTQYFEIYVHIYTHCKQTHAVFRNICTYIYTLQTNTRSISKFMYCFRRFDICSL